MTVTTRWGVPWSVTHPPEPNAWCTARPRVNAALDHAIAITVVVEVAAPGGFGKTVALADWARTRDFPVAWVSLDVHSRNPERLASALGHALRAATEGVLGFEDLPVEVPTVAYSSALVAHWIAALDQARGPVVLVVDDCHRVPGVLERGPLAALLEAAPRGLKFVLATRTSSPVLVRRRANGDAVLIDADTLRMDPQEVSALARAAGIEVAPGHVGELVESTGGWPLAVGLDLLTPHAVLPRAEGTIRSYLEQEVLDRLPRETRRLVLSTSLMAQFDARAAAEVSGLSDVVPVLDDLLRRGLFLSRARNYSGRTAYRWHARFARECREVLQHDDPDEFREISRATVRLLWFSDPLAALEAARLGGSDDLVLGLLREHWLPLLLEGDVDELRISLDALAPALRSETTAVVLEAALSDLLGDRELAEMLLHRASASTDDLPSRLAVALGRLLIEDAGDDLFEACDTLDALLRNEIAPGAPVHTPALFLLGWSEMRLRRDPLRALALLRSAGRKACGQGRPILARRCHANAAFAAAFLGNFEVALEEIALLGPAPVGPDLWEVYDGGIREFTEGWMAYWRGDIAEAQEMFALVAERHDISSYAPLARVLFVFAACADSDPAKIDRATLMRRDVPVEDSHGVPWGHYGQMASAKILAARDAAPQSVVAAAQAAADRAHVPVLILEAAGLIQRFGRSSDVVAQLQRLAPLERQPVHVQVGALVINALVQRRRGEVDSAHRLLERSLDLAAPLGLALAYRQSAPGLRALLSAHVERGTAYADFLSSALGAGEENTTGGVTLSSREREVMQYMRGTLSNVEIAEALHVSVNTVKTHQRSIYRKLGVGNRRDAVRVASGEV